ncbi:hypothetical protein GQ607_002040 [Colletotrichum asianum]|uniref:Uncharacterized protein n=1 Tax=Colletotrichum asianum TaxID=702518 RepID=A0A8H3WRF6_9PEZI|nr:hypothetical protein GQ607_002040 [Colletotrichum asianum]
MSLSQRQQRSSPEKHPTKRTTFIIHRPVNKRIRYPQFLTILGSTQGTTTARPSLPPQRSHHTAAPSSAEKAAPTPAPLRQRPRQKFPSSSTSSS